MPALFSSDVSDDDLLALAALSQRTGVPGRFLIEVYNSESGFKPLNPSNPSSPYAYWGPAEVQRGILAKYVDPDAFSAMNLGERFGYLDGMLKEQIKMNRGTIPDRPEVLYALNFVPAKVYNAGPNPPGSTLLVQRNGQFWADNPGLHKYADPEGITIDSMGRALDARRTSDKRLIELLARYELLSNETVQTAAKVGAGALVLGLGVLGAVGYYYYKRTRG